MFLNRLPAQRRSGLLSHAMLAGLAPARALSSYARRRYLAHYRGRRRFPRLLFAFDAALVLTVASLAVLVVSTLLAPPAQPALSLSLSAPPLTGGAPLPLTARVRAVGQATQRNVRVEWHLPPGTEILQTDAVTSRAGTAYIGELAPGAEFASHLVVRIYQAVGSLAQFGFTLHSDEGGRPRELVGLEQRSVVRSALLVFVPVAFQADTVPREGTLIPLQVQNLSDVTLPYAQIAFDPPHPTLGQSVTLGDLKAGERRFVFVPIEGPPSAARVSWIGSAAARELTRGSWSGNARRGDARVAPTSVAPAWSGLRIVGRPVSWPDGGTRVRLEGARAGDRLLIAHPFLAEPVQVIILNEGQTEVRLPPFVIPQASASRDWLAVPFKIGSDGVRRLGPAVLGGVRAPFPFTAQVRYTSPAGDQLGVGPQPPQAGFETRYWVFWRVGPVDDELQGVHVAAALTPGVRLTGNVTLPNGGDWSHAGNEIAWSLPALGASVSSPEALFGFEIAVRPRPADAGRLLTLVGTSTASARDPEDDSRFEISAPAQTSALPEDADKSEAGRVRR